MALVNDYNSNSLLDKLTILRANLQNASRRLPEEDEHDQVIDSPELNRFNNITNLMEMATNMVDGNNNNGVFVNLNQKGNSGLYQMKRRKSSVHQMTPLVEWPNDVMVVKNRTRFRAISTGSTVDNHHLGLSQQQLQLQLDPLEAKLATSGNIFERREDWLAILNKIPMSKQNSVHIRLEDEGPYGNDETRCFVLSHLSSLGIKRLACVFCRCSLIVYDRFPLVDGTLFLSPLMYDAHTSIGAVVNNKQVYLNALCVECLLGLPDTTSANNNTHQITCKYCHNSLHSLGALSLQIGTLYKFDLFAAFPCCSRRFSCVQCQHVIPVDLDANNHFSFFSEERECPACKTLAHHFVKAIDSVFIRPAN